ncbi:hypothetical protein ACQKKE_07245 [Desemzia incerta]|uniref:hypothetical protein n=1 Tax=Desemzia incerta TaxID=82801 RepID=UPI003D03EE60
MNPLKEILKVADPIINKGNEKETIQERMSKFQNFEGKEKLEKMYDELIVGKK